MKKYTEEIVLESAILKVEIFKAFFFLFGIFNIFVRMMAKTDPLLAEHYQTASGFKGDSKSIQNDLITVIAKVSRSTNLSF